MRYLRCILAGIAAVLVLGVIVGLTPGAVATRGTQHTSSPSTFVAAQGSVEGRQGSITSTVKGTFGKGGHVGGSFAPSRFVARKGGVYGVGILSARLTRADGTVLGRVHKYVSLPLRADGAAGVAPGKVCDILDLDLGPLHLNLLGLHVDLNRVILHITAHSGAGQLLGNLLCLVAHLLDGVDIKQPVRVANLLNEILSILRI